MSALLLFVVVVAFAWNLGVHYTGAVMGMPYAARAIALWPALALIAVMTLLGATFASGGVEQTVGHSILADRLVTVPDAIVIVLAAGALTLLYNALRLPTSTIQILVSCVVGVGLAAGIPIAWRTILTLAAIWVTAPFVACALGFLFTRLLDRVIPPAAAQVEVQAQLVTGAREESHPEPAHPLERAVPAVALSRHLPPAVLLAADEATPQGRAGSLTRTALHLLPLLLVLVGIFASFVLGANDVANATGAFILTHQYSPMLAGFIGGLAMAVGALTWGRRILHTVAFDVVKMDLTMASSAQGVQALVVLLAVTQGYFTSMNQALIGAMAGTGLARGRETVQRRQMLAIVRGWLIGPLSGLALAIALETALRLLGLR